MKIKMLKRIYFIGLNDLKCGKKYTYKMHIFTKFKIWKYANIYPSFYLKAKYE